jgi:hypothetical protein
VSAVPKPLLLPDPSDVPTASKMTTSGNGAPSRRPILLHEVWSRLSQIRHFFCLYVLEMFEPEAASSRLANRLTPTASHFSRTQPLEHTAKSVVIVDLGRLLGYASIALVHLASTSPSGLPRHPKAHSQQSPRPFRKSLRDSAFTRSSGSSVDCGSH